MNSRPLPGVSSTISVARIFDSGEGELPRELDRQNDGRRRLTRSGEVGLYRELALVRPEARAMSVMTTLAVKTGDPPTSRTRIVSEIQAIADRYRQKFRGRLRRRVGTNACGLRSSDATIAPDLHAP